MCDKFKYNIIACSTFLFDLLFRITCFSITGVGSPLVFVTPVIVVGTNIEGADRSQLKVGKFNKPVRKSDGKK